MNAWTLILCEGAHDQQAIGSLARICGDWKSQPGVPNSLPSELRKTFPTPKPTRSGGWQFIRPPDYLVKGDRYLVIRALDGADRVLGRLALDVLEQVRPNAVGVVVDANGVPVAARVDSFRDWYGRLYGHADKVRAGTVSGTDPRLGFWVAPNNKSTGRLDDLLIRAASRTRKPLVARGKRFAASLQKIEPGRWTQYRNKAILGAINQVVRPGASLAVSLQKTSGWLEPTLADLQPFKRLLQFLDSLTKP